MEFEYPRPLKENEIRLLTFSKNRKAMETRLKEINLEIKEYDLHSCPPYHTLSYTWGPPKSSDPDYKEADKVAIRLNQLEFKVYPNLFDALEHIQRAQVAEYYWIDALSINQNDLQEREVQVASMDRIYSSASRVDIWIGKSNYFSRTVTEMITRMSDPKNYSLAHERRERACGGILDFRDHSALIEAGLSPWKEEEWTAFIDFFRRRWFNRVWILQEVVLGKRPAILWADNILLLEMVESCVCFMRANGLDMSLTKFEMKNAQNHPGTLIGAESNVVKFIRGCQRQLQRSTDDALEIEDCWKPLLESAARCLYLILVNTLILKSSDPRDKIYAVLGIINRFSEVAEWKKLSITPNYTDSTAASVFTHATSTIIISSRCLDILTKVEDHTIRRTHDFPSWVPDFTSHGRNSVETILVYRKLKLFNPSRVESYNTESILIDGKRLHLKGIRIGNIVSKNRGVDFELLTEFEETYPFTMQNRVEAYWRTLIMDSEHCCYPARTQTGSAFGSWVLSSLLSNFRNGKRNQAELEKAMAIYQTLKILTSGGSSICLPTPAIVEESCRMMGLWPGQVEPGNEFEANEIEKRLFKDYSTFGDLVDGPTYKRTLLRTDKGHIGLGPQSMQIGDTVWIMPACSSLLVLRKSDEFSQLSSNGKPLNGIEHRLIGDAYVHGVMNGEAANDDTQWENICLV
jgi:heterokaryon incompatibility protein (HET)